MKMDSKEGSTKRKFREEITKGKGNNFEIGGVTVILNESKNVDRISHLPEDIIKHILSFLTPRDVVVTRTLGKIWSRSSPGLHLNSQHLNEKKAVVLFESYINKGATIRTFSLDITNPFKHSSCIKEWLQIAADNDMYVMHILFDYLGKHFPFPATIPTSKNLVVLRLKNCRLKGLSFTTKLHSLQELTLVKVGLSDGFDIPTDGINVPRDGFDALTSACYNLRKIQLKKCRIVKELDLNGLKQLEKVEIWRGCSLESKLNSWTQSIVLHSSSVKSFVIHECCSKSCELSFRQCNNLEAVWLHADIFPDYCYRIFLSKKINYSIPRLKRLFLHKNQQKDERQFLHGEHETRKKFRVERPTLEVLNISNLDGIENAIINTPRLHTFKFSGNSFEPFLFMMITAETLQKTSLKFHETCPINTSWFSQLILFGRKLSQDGVLSIRITNMVSFNLQDREAITVSPMLRLKYLKVKILYNLSLSSSKDLVNGLLWGFRPETLTLIMTRESREQIEVIQEHLQNKEGDTKESWRNSLKCMEIELSSRVRKKRTFQDLVEFKITFQWLNSLL